MGRGADGPRATNDRTIGGGQGEEYQMSDRWTSHDISQDLLKSDGRGSKGPRSARACTFNSPRSHPGTGCFPANEK